jgi:hypothetical protein
MSGNQQTKSPFILRSEINELSSQEAARRAQVLTELSADEIASVAGAHCDIHPPAASADFTIDPTWDPQNGGDSEACDD